MRERVPGVNTVLASEWNISFSTGSHITGAILHVHRPADGFGVIHHSDYDGMVFPSLDAAHDFALEVGLLKVYVPRRVKP